jgi:hypothetical protein
MNVRGSTYLFTFDALFEPSVTIQRRNEKRLGKGILVHVLQYNPSQETVLTINLPREVIVLDIKSMRKTVEDHALNL